MSENKKVKAKKLSERALKNMKGGHWGAWSGPKRGCPNACRAAGACNGPCGRSGGRATTPGNSGTIASANLTSADFDLQFTKGTDGSEYRIARKTGAEMCCGV